MNVFIFLPSGGTELIRDDALEINFNPETFNPESALEIYYNAEILQWQGLSRFLFSLYVEYSFK